MTAFKEPSHQVNNSIRVLLESRDDSGMRQGDVISPSLFTLILPKETLGPYTLFISKQ